MAQGLPAEPNLDGVRPILNLANPGFSGSAGRRSPGLVLLLALPQFPCVPRSCRRWGGLKAAQHLRGDPAVCEGFLPGSEGADLWDRAQLAPPQSLWLFQFLGKERTPSLRATTSPPFGSLYFKHFFGTFPPTKGTAHPLAASSSPPGLVDVTQSPALS